MALHSREALLHIEVISLRKAIKLALKAIEENSPKNYLPGYLSLTDSILEQIAFYDHRKIDNPAVRTEESLLDKFVKAKELVYRLEHRMLYKLADSRTFPGQRKEVSNEKVARVKRLQELVDNFQVKPSIKDRIAQLCESEDKFSPEDIHVEMVKISFGSDDDGETHPLDKIRFVSKYDLSKPNPKNEFEKTSTLVSLVCPEEFFEYQLRIFTKKHGLKTNIVKQAFDSWYLSDNERYEHPGSTRGFSKIGEVETLKCGPEGDTFHLQKHGIKIIVPSGAIDKKTIFEFAVYLDGPFEFARDKRPVSPILWICTKPHIKEFAEPIKVVIPHIFTELSEKDESEFGLDIVKADHSTDFRKLRDGSKIYTFKSVQDSNPVLSKGVGTISLYHCCYLCIEASNKADIAANAGFCLSQYHSSKGLRDTVTFCATYCLDTCLKALDDQFPPPSYSQPLPSRPFNFRKSTGPGKADPYLHLDTETQLGGVIISVNPQSRKIFASEIDFWKHNDRGVDLNLLHQRKMYPPRVIFDVDRGSCDRFQLIFNVTVMGFPNDDHLNAELTFPLIPTQGALVDRHQSQESRIKTVKDKPKLNELLLELCTKVSHLWQNIGILLEIDAGKLDDIKTSENNVAQNCLREMLIVWTKQVNPPPSWWAIAEAIKCLGDEELAHHLKTKYVHV